MTTKSWSLFLLPVCVVFSVVSTAPVEHEVAKKAVIGDRESTKQILNLEQQLKQQAGEDKKFYPSQGSHPVPQVDGLLAAHSSGEEEKDDVIELPSTADNEKVKTVGNGSDSFIANKNGLNNIQSDDEADLRQAAIMEQAKEVLDDDILELLRENPELWDEVLSGKIY